MTKIQSQILGKSLTWSADKLQYTRNNLQDNRRGGSLERSKHFFQISSGLIVGISLLLVPGFSFPIWTGEALHLLSDREGVNGLPEKWLPLTFRKVSRHTEYKLVQEGDRPTIRAKSNRSASGIYRPLDLDPQVYQVLSWCWKIDRIISKGDASRKEGDDYAARIYVTFKYDPDRAGFWERAKFGVMKLLYGEYPPKGTLTYIWANRLPKGQAVANAYTDRAKMIAVESGEAKVGQWLCEKRNIYEDYRTLFGEAPPMLSGVAVMTDTDNTGEEASATYADLVVQPAVDEGPK